MIPDRPAASPPTLAGIVAAMIAGEGTLEALLGTFLDAFYAAPVPQRQAMINEEPARICVEREDAWLGAVGEHLARRWGLRVPAWTDAPWREVAKPWFVDGDEGVRLSGLYLVQSPVAFRRRRIFVEAEPLRRASMPIPRGDGASAWTHLITEGGEIDGYLLTLLGRLDDSSDARLSAARGGYDPGADPADMVVVIQRGAETTLVDANAIAPIYGPSLPADDIFAVASFARRHHAALVAHWSGETCSLDLVRAIERAERKVEDRRGGEIPGG